MQSSSPTRQDIIRFGVFEADLHTGELRKSGAKIRLQEQPFQILLMLLQRPSEVVTREELQRKLWPADTFVDFEHGVNSAVARLREALGDSAESPRYVETLPRRGYRSMYVAKRIWLRIKAAKRQPNSRKFSTIAVSW